MHRMTDTPEPGGDHADDQRVKTSQLVGGLVGFALFLIAMAAGAVVPAELADDVRMWGMWSAMAGGCGAYVLVNYRLRGVDR